MSLLSIKDFSVLKKGVPLVSGASLSISMGEAVGLFGSSGSGKSVFSLFLLGLLDFSVFTTSAKTAVFFNQKKRFNLLSKNEQDWNLFRRSCVSMVFQDPSVALNPTISCGKQVEESFVNSSVVKKNCLNLFKLGTSIFFSSRHS